jgi:hypothetical protein
MELTTKNIDEVSLEDMRSHIFGMIELHVDLTEIDRDKFGYLLGYYPAMYNYVAELFTHQIARVRDFTEIGDKFRAGRARDRRDILEEALKSIKLQYESLSRKITLLSPDAGRGERI